MTRTFFDDGAPAGGRQKILLATVAYDSPDASYTHALQRSRVAMTQRGMNTAYLLLSGNCHVDDARNTALQEFLLTDCTDLIFLDADVTWEIEDLIRLCEVDLDLVGGVYPYRREGMADTMPVNMLPTAVEPDENGVLEVMGMPAGFMRIRRRVVETLTFNARHFHKRGDRRSKIPLLFERVYANGTRWGGDIHFCNLWRNEGGKCHVLVDLRLGHVAKTVVRDSLAAALRRQTDATLRYVVDEIRAGSTDLNLFREALAYCNNPYNAVEDSLGLAVFSARKANGPILETGSGLSSILMAAAAPKQRVWSLENDLLWVAWLRKHGQMAGVDNIAICHQPLQNGWYVLDDLAEAGFPHHFALALHDGPSRKQGDRRRFFDTLADRCETIVVDDADEQQYGDFIAEWCRAHGRQVHFLDERAALIRHAEEKEKVA